MSLPYIESEHFNGQHYTEQPLPTGEYEHCSFSNCVFLNADLSDIIFSSCTFTDCDVSMATLAGTAFRDVMFKNCKLLGLRFNDCNSFLLSFDFDSCVLNFSSFYKVNLKNTHFKNCKLEEVEFVESDLTKAVFSQCDLINAVFENTNLEGADLRTAVNFSIDPATNRIAKAKFSTHNIAGLLHTYNIIIE